VNESTPEGGQREGSSEQRDVVDREELAGAAFSAVRWTGLARMAGEVVAFAATVALARLLTPADFGVAAVAMVATTIALQTGQQGLTAPLVQRRAIDDAHLRVAVLLSLVLGLTLAALVAVVGEPLLQPVFGDDIAELIPLTAPFFVLAGLSAVPQARLERSLGFRQLGLIYVARMVTGSLASVALALGGVDAAALVLGPLAGVAIATLMLLVISPTVRPAWHRAEAREILRFGFPSLGSGLASIGAQHIDYAVVAARLPAASVGLYWRAYTLGVDYQGKLSGILVQIGLPLYARAADLATRQAMRERIVRLQTLLLFPLLGALILLAPVAVPLIFGDQWEEAVEPTQILAVAGMMAAIQAGTGPLLLAVGRPGVLLRWNLSKIIGLGVVVYFVAPEGLVALAAAVTIFNVARSLIGQQILLSRYAGIDVRGLFFVCLPALTATAAMLLLGWGVLAYIATLALAFPAALTELRDVRNRLLPRRPRLRGTKTGGYTEARPGA
jgi:O-antigen/teichoic acid export membrane protein